MADEFDPSLPPREVIQLKAAWLLVRDEVAEVSAEEPAGELLQVAGHERRTPSDDQARRFQRAQGQLAQLSSAILASAWRRAVSKGGGWSTADKALAEAAAVLVDELSAQSPSALRELANRLTA